MNVDNTSAQPAVRLAEPYATRSVRCLDLLAFDGWRLKLYADDRYGVGFVGAHDGRGSNFVFVDWWADEDELHHHTWLSTKEEPGELRATGPDELSACAWDLAVIGHERAAWLRHVLARADGPDLDAYLGDRVDADV